MKFTCMSMLIFFIAMNAFADPDQLDFHSYVRENYQILTKVKKPERAKDAFKPVEQREPANEPAMGYENDKTGHVAASSGSVWGGMSGQNNQNQQQQQQPVQQPSQSQGSSSSSGSSSSGGDQLPQ